MTTHSKLIYALKDGNIVSIDEVQNGKDCGCVCPACGNKLWARKGEQRMHHFAHEPHTHCEYGYESSLHLATKDILSRSEKMVIPPVYIERTRNHFLIHSSVLLNLFLFFGPLGLDYGRLMTPFRKWVSSNLPKKTNNPNPSSTGKTRFGLYWFGAGNRTRTCTLLAVEPKSTESTNSTMPAYFRRMRRCLLPIRPSGLS